MLKIFFMLVFFIANLVANYESTYERAQVKTDFDNQEITKYKREKTPYLGLEDLKAKGIFSKDKTLVRELKDEPFNYSILSQAGSCENLDGNFTATIYSFSLENGTVTCMVAVTGDLRNPIGLYNVFYPGMKKYYSLDKAQAKKDKAALLKASDEQFQPLYEKRRELAKSVENLDNSNYLNITQLLTASILTDTDIIDIEASSATGVLQLKDTFTSKYITNQKNGNTNDNSEYILTDVGTIFEVYGGLSDVSMGYLILLVVFFGVHGVGRAVLSPLADKMEKKQTGEKPVSWGAGLVAGILLFFPTSDHDTIKNSSGDVVGSYSIMKTKYQTLEKSGYYLFGEWADASAKVIINAEMDAIISKSGIGTREQIINTYAGLMLEIKLRDFYTQEYSMCEKTYFAVDNMTGGDGKKIYSETEYTIFPMTENFLFAKSLVLTGGMNYYSAPPSGLVYDAAYSKEAITKSGGDIDILEGLYPLVSISSCGKAYTQMQRHTKTAEDYGKQLSKLFSFDNKSDSLKIKMLIDLIDFQYKLYREWGYLSILGLPVTKMQTEYIGGLYEKNNEVMDKLNSQVKSDSNGAHMIMSSIPYMFIPGASSVYTVISDNSGKLGAAIGGTAGSPGGLLSVVTGAFGAVVGTVGGSAMGAWGAYTVSKTVLELMPIIGIVIVGLVRFIIIMIKIFSFHFASLFLMPIMFARENIQAISKFSMKVFATMLELPMFVLAVWLAITANSLIHNIGDVFSKKIILGMLQNNESQYALTSATGFTQWTSKLKIYVFGGFIEIAMSVFAIVIIYKLIITLHTTFFEVLEIQGSQSLDNSIESMKNEAGGWGSKI